MPSVDTPTNWFQITIKLFFTKSYLSMWWIKCNCIYNSCTFCQLMGPKIPQLQAHFLKGTSYSERLATTTLTSTHATIPVQNQKGIIPAHLIIKHGGQYPSSQGLVAVLWPQFVLILTLSYLTINKHPWTNFRSPSCFTTDCKQSLCSNH
jgi:hypothetical protein